MGIEVLRPDINESDTDFTVVMGARRQGKRAKKVIRFGLGAVKGVGEGAVDVIKPARDEGGPLPPAFPFLQRGRGAQGETKRARGPREAGAFDGVAAEERRVARAAVLRDRHGDRARRRGAARARERPDEPARAVRRGAAAATARQRQGTGGAAATATASSRTSTPTPTSGCPRSCWPTRRRALGFYISGHPLDRYLGEIKTLHQRHGAQLHREGRARRGHPGRRRHELPGTPHEERQRQVRLLDAGGPLGPDRVHRQLEEGRGLPRAARQATSRCWSTAPSTPPSATARPRASACASTTPSCCRRSAAEKSSLLDIRLNADVIKASEAWSPWRSCCAPTPAPAARRSAWRSPSAARPSSTWATTTRSPPRTTCWPASSRSSGRRSRSITDFALGQGRFDDFRIQV